MGAADGLLIGLTDDEALRSHSPASSVPVRSTGRPRRRGRRGRRGPRPRASEDGSRVAVTSPSTASTGTAKKREFGANGSGLSGREWVVDADDGITRVRGHVHDELPRGPGGDGQRGSVDAARSRSGVSPETSRGPGSRCTPTTSSPYASTRSHCYAACTAVAEPAPGARAPDRGDAWSPAPDVGRHRDRRPFRPRSSPGPGSSTARSPTSLSPCCGCRSPSRPTCWRGHRTALGTLMDRLDVPAVVRAPAAHPRPRVRRSRPAGGPPAALPAAPFVLCLAVVAGLNVSLTLVPWWPGCGTPSTP